MSVQTIMVIRHGDDLTNNWPKSSDVYTLPSGQTVATPQHGLTQAGFARAQLLSTAIPAYIANKNFAPVTRVITKDPRSLSYTPNPFDTIRPFIMSQSVKDVELIVDLNTLTPLIQNNQILPTNGSVVICWDVEGMWGPKVNNVRPINPLSSSILGMLKSQMKIDGNNYPQKGGTLYCFNNPVNGIYHLTISALTNNVFV
jgi:hypothetical protein